MTNKQPSKVHPKSEVKKVVKQHIKGFDNSSAWKEEEYEEFAKKNATDKVKHLNRIINKV